MKIFYVASVVIAIMLLAPLFQVDAAVITVMQPKTSFKVKAVEIEKVKNTNTSIFTFEPIEIVNPQNIAYWKVRTYCDKSMAVVFSGFNESVCGKAVRIENTSPNRFLFSMTNNGNDTKSFSFKFKAYDKNGKWLHSEQQSFQWK